MWIGKWQETVKQATLKNGLNPCEICQSRSCLVTSMQHDGKGNEGSIEPAQEGCEFLSFPSFLCSSLGKTGRYNPFGAKTHRLNADGAKHTHIHRKLFALRLVCVCVLLWGCYWLMWWEMRVKLLAEGGSCFGHNTHDALPDVWGPFITADSINSDFYSFGIFHSTNSRCTFTHL